MSAPGVGFRLARLGRDGRFVMVPMDHGITQGPLDGLVDIRPTASAVVEGGADAVLTHRGLAERVRPAVAGAAGFVVHLNASTVAGPDPDDKRQVCSVEDAIAHGADAVSFHLNVGSEHEPDQLAALGAVIARAHRFGLPVVAMAYPRGPTVDPRDPDDVAHAVRVATELGADVVKTSYPGAGFEDAVAATDAPVVIAGGEPEGPSATLERVADAMARGAAGVSMGRSVFGHPSPGRMAAAVAAVVHDGATAAAAMEHLDT